MEQKIHNTFTRMEDEIAKFDKVFAKGGKFEQAVAQSQVVTLHGLTTCVALDKLAETLMDCPSSYSQTWMKMLTKAD